ncbi:MAG: Uma2 family endonuclease [bacterium]|nr:Uma2 family endonuclease [bacterium]
MEIDLQQSATEQTRPAQKMTVEQFDVFVLQPENADRNFEYVRGEAVEVVSNPKSSSTGARFITYMGMYLLHNDIGHLTGADGGYYVSGERYIPDVGFISYARQPELAYREGYVAIAPDLAVEVLSPSDTDDRLRVKVANYLAAGTVVWMVDVEAQIVEVYVPGKPVKQLDKNGVLDGGSVLPGFTLAVKDVFAVK